MQQPPPPDLPPTGDQLGEDLYTSATADLSAGGVAMAREAAEQQEHLGAGSAQPAPGSPISDPTPAQIYAREDLVSDTERPTFVTDYSAVETGEQSPVSRIDPTWAIAGGGVVAVGGGIAAAWLYSRWQRERNRPINRLRRRARGFANVLSDRFEEAGERLPDVDDMRDTAPMSGGAAAAVIGGLVLARLLHVGGWGQRRITPSADTLREAGRSGSRAGTRWGAQLRGLQDIDVRAARNKVPNVDLKSAREKVRNLDVKAARGRVQSLSMPAAPRPMGLGLGGLVGVCAVGYLVWRLVRGGGSHPQQQNWYMGDEPREQVPNQ